MKQSCKLSSRPFQVLALGRVCLHSRTGSSIVQNKHAFLKYGNSNMTWATQLKFKMFLAKPIPLLAWNYKSVVLVRDLQQQNFAAQSQQKQFYKKKSKKMLKTCEHWNHKIWCSMALPAMCLYTPINKYKIYIWRPFREIPMALSRGHLSAQETWRV